ncbi:MAG: DNA primase, partial [Bdellovibrionales bacterium]
MKFPQEFIDRVREATDIVPLVSQYVQLRRTGGNHQGLCPFHNEKSPSFSVSEDKQVYYCFGCKASGNVITFVQNYQGLTFPETIEYLARRASIALPATSEQGDPAREMRNTFFKINALAANFYHQEYKKLPEGHEVKKYFASRGLTEELAEMYKLGYAPEAWSDLTHFFESKRVPVAPSEQLGLIKRRSGEKSNGHYDLFRHRVMFPIFSPTGSCVGFGGRVLSKDQQPKYLNSPDSPVFHKGKVFYGLDHSAKFIRTEDEAIVVEGYMDWLALAKVSVNNIVATLGTALTVDHAKLIKRYTNKVLLLFD